MNQPTVISRSAFFCLWLFSLSILYGTKLTAQDPADIDTIVVRTTRIPLKASETGRNISIIDSKTIQGMAANSLDELLQYIPGIELQSRNAFGAQADITLRGSTYSQVLVLIDGMKLNDPLTAHFNSYIPVTPAEIERIEVLRGAASAIYGADAVGGVINIITKGFQAEKSESSEGMAEVNFGEHKLVSAEHGFSIRKENYHIGGGFSMNQSDGEFIPEKEVGGNLLEPYNNNFNIKTFGLSYGVHVDDRWYLAARSGYDDRDYSARYFYTTSTFDKSTEKTRNWWNHLALSRQGDRTVTDVQIAYRHGTDEFIFSPDFPSTNRHSTHYINANFNQLHLVNDQFSLKYGGQADRRSVESTDRGDHDDWHFGLYTVGNWRSGSNFNLSGSIRLDQDANYGLEISPQLNFSYWTDRMTWRASAGRTIRAADYTERYVSFNLPNLTPGRNLGNPDLEAETAWSEEIGVDLRITEGWQLKFTAFNRDSKNLIDYVQTNESGISNNQNLQPGANYFYATNIASVNTKGIELESWVRKSLNDQSHLIWSFGYTYLDSGSDDDVVSVYLSSHAKHLMTANLIVEAYRWDIALSGIYKNRSMRISSDINATLDPSYQLWNLRLGYELNAQLGLNFQVHNLFDEVYQDILGAPMPGRWVKAGVKLNW